MKIILWGEWELIKRKEAIIMRDPTSTGRAQETFKMNRNSHPLETPTHRG